MSYDEFAWAGFGVWGFPDDKKTPTQIRAVFDDDDMDLETVMDEFLAAHELDKVAVVDATHTWSEPDVKWCLVVTRSLGSVVKDDSTGRLTPPSEEELAQLRRAMELLAIDDEPGWMIHFEVN